MVLELVKYNTKSGRNALTTPTTRYVFGDHTEDETNQLAKDMVEAMYKYGGVGVSANQLGLPWSIFAMRGMPADFVCFNPTIAMPSNEIVKLEEACLSFPGLVLPLERPRHGRVRFAGPNGEMGSHTFTGMTYRVFQHEMCHLEGRMFFEGVSRINLERGIRQAKRKGFDYSAEGFMRHAKKR
jgi:peptide deformylase